MRPGYVWRDPERPLAVDLALGVVSRLGLEALEAYRAVPHRGLEIGGVLVGRSETAAGVTTIYIEDFAAVDSEHPTGPSYLPSEIPRERLEEELAAHPDAVGWYRTQTRSPDLGPEQDDARLFREVLGGGGLFLLIRPAEGEGEIFLPENGEFVSLHRFPFRASELADEAGVSTGETAAQRASTAERATALEAARLAARTHAEMPPARRARFGVRNLLIGAAALVLGAATGAALYRYMPHGGAGNTAQPAAAGGGAARVPAAVPAAAAGAAPHVALEVQRNAQLIRLLWDRNAPMIRAADHATLYIEDGTHQSRLDLDRRELDSGLVSYWPETRDVEFRLDVFAPNQSSEDTIRVVGGPPAAQGETEHHPRADAGPAAGAAANAAARPAAAAPSAARESEGGEEGGRAEAAAVPRASPFPAVEKPAAAPAVTKPAPAPAAVEAEAVPVHAATPPRTTEEQPVISVREQAVPPSRMAEVVGRIPLLRRLRRRSAVFVPPQPIHEPRPRLDRAETRFLTEEVAVDVRVFITSTGRVDYAEPVSSATGKRRELAATAVYTARHWSFVPARMGEEKVASEAILHFRFAPAPPPPAGAPQAQ